ncbi:mitochondrial carrier domain-containing protein [Spinellus fusiger]|nr:mitochondrial carrier domain-containing protein [Spinellus fusiger]
MAVDSEYLFASGVAGLVSRVCTHPIDTIKTRMQVSVSSNPSKRGFWLQEILFHKPTNSSFSASSLLSLYRGLPVTLIFGVPALTVYLSCYDYTKTWLANNTQNMPADAILNHMISGGTAEIVAGTLFTPMEVLKSRLQIEKHINRGTPAVDLAQSIMKREGISGLFRGYGIGLAVFMPYTMVYFSVYEKLKSKAAGLLRLESQDVSLPFSAYLICSGLASTVGIVVSTPLDIIKTRWQISSAEEGVLFRKGPVTIARELWINEGGWRILFRSLGARITWGIPSTMISMSVFEKLKSR